MIFFRKARRRSPGVYWYRTRRHDRRGTEWGYVGKSNYLARRADCHEGRCTRHPACHGGKPWADLITHRGQLQLPWWLGWQPVTLSLETMVIWFLRPRYNWQKNPRRSKVPYRIQQLQRADRDTGAYAWAHTAPAPQFTTTDLAICVAGGLCILFGLTGMVMALR